MSEPARTNPSPTAANAIEDEVQEALAICGGDAIAALRITLIANAFLEAEIDRLSAAVSSGFESKVLLRDASALVECGAVGRRQYRCPAGPGTKH